MLQKKKKHIAILAGAVSLLIISCLYFYHFHNQKKYVLIGELYANDCGAPRGGFEWCGLYNLTIEKGEMVLKLAAGLGDPLIVNRYPCETLTVDAGKSIRLKVYDQSKTRYIEIELTYYEEDPIWGIRNMYIAYYVDPTIFQGFKDHYYVEIRIYKIIEK